MSRSDVALIPANLIPGFKAEGKGSSRIQGGRGEGSSSGGEDPFPDIKVVSDDGTLWNWEEEYLEELDDAGLDVLHSRLPRGRLVTIGKGVRIRLEPLSDHSESPLPELFDKKKHSHIPLPLLEVFSVVIDINNSDDGDEKRRAGGGLLYGKIDVEAAFGPQTIYERNKWNAETIFSGDCALLSGPTRYISALDPLAVHVDLRYKVEDSSPDSEVIEGMLVWSIYDWPSRQNEVLSAKFYGGTGTATVNYIVLRDAVVATVEVTLLKSVGRRCTAGVYGLIEAGSDCRSFSYRTTLFRMKRDGYMNLHPGEAISLSKSVVAVHLRSALKVSVELSDYFSSPNKRIAMGIVEFPAQFSGTAEKKMSCKYGEILVKVTWKAQ